MAGTSAHADLPARATPSPSVERSLTPRVYHGHYNADSRIQPARAPQMSFESFNSGGTDSGFVRHSHYSAGGSTLSGQSAPPEGPTVSTGGSFKRGECVPPQTPTPDSGASSAASVPLLRHDASRAESPPSLARRLASVTLAVWCAVFVYAPFYSLPYRLQSNGHPWLSVLLAGSPAASALVAPMVVLRMRARGALLASLCTMAVAGATLLASRLLDEHSGASVALLVAAVSLVGVVSPIMWVSLGTYTLQWAGVGVAYRKHNGLFAGVYAATYQFILLVDEFVASACGDNVLDMHYAFLGLACLGASLGWLLRALPDAQRHHTRATGDGDSASSATRKRGLTMELSDSQLSLSQGSRDRARAGERNGVRASTGGSDTSGARSGDRTTNSRTRKHNHSRRRAASLLRQASARTPRSGDYLAAPMPSGVLDTVFLDNGELVVDMPEGMGGSSRSGQMRIRLSVLEQPRQVGPPRSWRQAFTVFLWTDRVLWLVAPLFFLYGLETWLFTIGYRYTDISGSNARADAFVDRLWEVAGYTGLNYGLVVMAAVLSDAFGRTFIIVMCALVQFVPSIVFNIHDGSGNDDDNTGTFVEVMLSGVAVAVLASQAIALVADAYPSRLQMGFGNMVFFSSLARCGVTAYAVLRHATQTEKFACLGIVLVASTPCTLVGIQVINKRMSRVALRGRTLQRSAEATFPRLTKILSASLVGRVEDDAPPPPAAYGSTSSSAQPA